MTTGFQYQRCVFQSGEWEELVESGWRTVTVNADGIALMIRRSS